MLIREASNKFFIGETEETALAEITFDIDQEMNLIINHTRVDISLRGHGIAEQLLEKVVEKARTTKVKVVPICSYAAKKMIGNEKYKDILLY
jgi:predicted GNAT family acetyltransferase